MALTLHSVFKTWRVVPKFGILSLKCSDTFVGKVSETLSIITNHLILTSILDLEGSTSPPIVAGLMPSQSRLTVASIVASGRLPDPALGIISELDAAIKVISKSNHGKERICEYILNEVPYLLAG